jgi:uncharacterized membrane protein
MPELIHPSVVHLPLALSILLPLLCLAFIIFIKLKKMHLHSWWIVVALQFMLVLSGYVALESGERDEERVEKVVSEEFIHQHEEAAEIFVGVSVIALVISIASLFAKEKQAQVLRWTVMGVSLISGGLAVRTGYLGGELVYRHGAAQAYSVESGDVEETTTQKSSEENNESLKKDDNDYGQSDENEDSSDDQFKQED